MKASPNILAIIPARGGSKSIRKKNLAPIGGKPLIFWTIKAALDSGCFKKIVVSSDDREILAAAGRCGVEPLVRPKALAKDSSQAWEVVRHTLASLKKKGYASNIIAYLQPTSPFRGAEDIKTAVRSLLESGSRALISVKIADSIGMKGLFPEGRLGYLKLLAPRFAFRGRQEIPPLYLPNGAIYLIFTREFNKTRQLFSPRTLAYVMPESRSTDIDNAEDLRYARKFFKKLIKHEFN